MPLVFSSVANRVNRGVEMEAYIAVSKNLTDFHNGIPFQHEIGKTHIHNGEVVIDKSGFIAYRNPLDLLRHYHKYGGVRYFKVECGGTITHQNERNGILACSEITLKSEINLCELIASGVWSIYTETDAASDWEPYELKCQNTEPIRENGIATTLMHGYFGIAENGSAATLACENFSTAATSGAKSTALATGSNSTAATSGQYSMAATTHNQGTAATSGSNSKAAARGYESMAAASGTHCAAAADGYESAAAASGAFSIAATCESESIAATSGIQSVAVASGSKSTATASGHSCNAIADGEDCIAVANGGNARAKGKKGCYLAITEYDNTGRLLNFITHIIDGETIKEDVYYMVKDGRFVEACIDAKK